MDWERNYFKNSKQLKGKGKEARGSHRAQPQASLTDQWAMTTQTDAGSRSSGCKKYHMPTKQL